MRSTAELEIVTLEEATEALIERFYAGPTCIPQKDIIADLREQRHETLRFSNSDLSAAEDIICVAQFISANPSVQRLELKYCKINADGMKLLADALTYNSTLTQLYLSANRFGVQGFGYLADALKENAKLTYIDICAPSIEDILSKEPMLDSQQFRLQFQFVKNKLFENFFAPFYICMLLSIGNSEEHSELSLLNHDLISLLCRQVFSVFPQTRENNLTHANIIKYKNYGCFKDPAMEFYVRIRAGLRLCHFDPDIVFIQCEKRKGMTALFDPSQKLNETQIQLLNELAKLSSESIHDETDAKSPSTFFFSKREHVCEVLKMFGFGEKAQEAFCDLYEFHSSELQDQHSNNINTLQ